MESSDDSVRESEAVRLQRLERILDSTPCVVVAYDREWRVEYASARASEFVGSLDRSLAWDDLSRAFDASHREALERAAADGETAYCETYHEALDRWYEVQAHPNLDGVIAHYQDITRRKRVERELGASQALNRQIVEAVAAGVVHILSKGSIAHANEEAQRVAGLTLDELSKRFVRDFEGETFAEDGSPMEAGDYPASKCLRTGEPYIGTVMGLRRPDGEMSWGIYSAIPLRDVKTFEITGVVVTIVDITKRKQAEAAFRESEQRFAAFMEHSPTLAFAKSPDGQFVYANAAILRSLQLDEVGIVGKTDYDFMPKEIADVVRANDDAVRASGRAAEFVEVVPGPEGKSRTFLVHKFPFTDSSGRALLGGMATDLTERLRLEEQLMHARKMEAIGRLAGGIAHDFNNLMTIVGGYATFLLRGLADDHPLHDDAEQIRRAAERATRLTRQLLAFGRRQILRPQIVDLNLVIGEITKMLSRLLGEDVELRLDLSEDIGYVRIDPGQLEQVIVNLAINAREAMPEGGRLEVQTARETLDEPRVLPYDRIEPACYTVLRIRDSGTGIDESTFSHLFEPFFSTKGFNRGMGLSSIYGIVKQSGGSILVESEVGTGTTFAVFLPEAPESPRRATSQAPAVAPASRGETVMIVEDDEDVKALMVEMLTLKGYTTIDSADPIEAIGLCERHEGAIDLLVTDVVMPKLSGPQLAEQLVAIRPDMRVLFVSGYVENEATRRVVSSGRAAFLAKPFTLEEFMRKIRHVLEAVGGRR